MSRPDVRHSLLAAFGICLLAGAANVAGSAVQDIKPAPGKILLKSLPHPHDVRRCTFAPDGKHLAVATNDDNFPANVAKGGVIVVWDMESNEVAWQVAIEPPPYALAYSPDGRKLAIACAGPDAVYHLLDVRTRKLLWTTKDTDGETDLLAFSPDGKKLATHRESELLVRDAATGKVEKRWEGYGKVAHAAWSADGKTLAACCPQTMHLYLWDFASDKMARKIDTRGDYAEFVAYLPDGKSVLFAGRRHKIHDQEKATLFWISNRPLPFPRTEAFTVVGRLGVCDLQNWKSLRDMDQVEFDIQSMCATPDRKAVAIGGRTILGDPFRMAKVYDVATGKQLLAYTDPERFKWPARTTHIALSPDARRLAVIGQGKVVELVTMPPGN